MSQRSFSDALLDSERGSEVSSPAAEPRNPGCCMTAKLDVERAYGKWTLCFDSQIHANCRIRRVYFSDRLYSEDELPAEFKLYLPVQNKAKVS